MHQSLWKNDNPPYPFLVPFYVFPYLVMKPFTWFWVHYHMGVSPALPPHHVSTHPSQILVFRQCVRQTFHWLWSDRSIWWDVTPAATYRHVCDKTPLGVQPFPPSIHSIVLTQAWSWVNSCMCPWLRIMLVLMQKELRFSCKACISFSKILQH